VTTETFVPILFEKSSWAIVGMIAIMKAGGACKWIMDDWLSC
jgi:hypothetical protein